VTLECFYCSFLLIRSGSICQRAAHPLYVTPTSSANAVSFGHKSLASYAATRKRRNFVFLFDQERASTSQKRKQFVIALEQGLGLPVFFPAFLSESHPHSDITAFPKDLSPSPCFNSLSYIRRILAELLDRSAILKLFIAEFTHSCFFFFYFDNFFCSACPSICHSKHWRI